jgi:hypothetical protein
MTLILLALASFGALAVASGTLSTHRGAGMDQRGKEVYAVASGGLNQAVAWFEENYTGLVFDSSQPGAAWSSDAAGQGDSPIEASAYVDKDLAADSYNLAVSYEALSTLTPANSDEPVIVRARATASGTSDTHVARTVSVDLLVGRKSIFSPAFAASLETFSAPALLVESGLNAQGGSASIYPSSAGGIAVGITRGGLADVDVSGVDLKDGGVVGALSGSPTLSEAVFGLPSDLDGDGNPVGASRAERMLRGLERSYPDTVMVIDGDYPHYTGQADGWNPNSRQWNDDVGSRDEPVILFFAKEAGCPKLNGNTEIFGLVYIEATHCDLNGMGNSEIRGTLAVAGAPQKLNGNTRLYAEDLDFSGVAQAGQNRIALGFAQPLLVRIPGSWRDF